MKDFRCRCGQFIARIAKQKPKKENERCKYIVTLPKCNSRFEYLYVLNIFFLLVIFDVLAYTYVLQFIFYFFVFFFW